MINYTDYNGKSFPNFCDSYHLQLNWKKVNMFDNYKNQNENKIPKISWLLIVFDEVHLLGDRKGR